MLFLRILLALVFIFQLIALPNDSLSAEKKNKKGSNLTSSSKYKYQTTPFVESQDKLPQYFIGNNIYSISEILLKNTEKTHKKEFETTEQYWARMDKIKSSRLTDSLNYDSPISVWVTEDALK